jgi:hypothetical protein
MTTPPAAGGTGRSFGPLAASLPAYSAIAVPSRDGNGPGDRRDGRDGASSTVDADCPISYHFDRFWEKTGLPELFAGMTAIPGMGRRRPG